MGLLFGTREAPPEPRQAERSMAFPFTGPSTYAQVDTSGEGARQSVAIDASIDLLASLASELPVHVYRGQGRDREQLSLPSYLQDPGETGQGLEDWIYCGVNSWLYRGNLYGRELSWHANGKPRQIELFHPDDVRPMQDPDAFNGVRWLLNGAPIPSPRTFVHRRAYPMPGRLLGASVLERHAVQTRTSVAAALFGDQWFSDGAHPSALLVNEADLDQEQIRKTKQRWMANFQGSREPAVLGKGWKYQPIQVTANESQFLETMGWTEAQCARIFGPAMPETLGYATGGSMTYANVVDRRSDLLQLSLNRWLRRMERLLTSLLPSPSQYVRFDRDALLETSTLARYEAHAKAAPWKTKNEIRADEDMPPIEGGDVPPTMPQPERPAQ